MSRNEIPRNQKWRLGIIRHAEEVTMNQDRIYLRDVLKNDRRRILYFCDRCGRRLDY